MIAANGLLPIVLGIGLAVLSGGTFARGRGGASTWRDPLFVLAVLLIALPVFGAALYELGWSIETGRKLPAAEARAENWLILSLALLLVAVAARSAWVGFFYSTDSAPWERGYLDRLPQLLGFAAASLGVLLIGLVVDAVVLVVAKLEPGGATFIVAVTLALGVISAWVTLRLMSGGNPSPRALLMSRAAQLKMLSTVDGASGEWRSVEVSAVGRLDQTLSLSATVWITARGMYWRTDDAYALARFHDWVANHLEAPTPAVHTQRLILANPTRSQARHIELQPWAGRRERWLHALKMNRIDRLPCTDSTSAEHAAGLVHVPYDRLSAAGLSMGTRDSKTARWKGTQMAFSYDSSEVPPPPQRAAPPEATTPASVARR
jgi:hypothetical protein